MTKIMMILWLLTADGSWHGKTAFDDPDACEAAAERSAVAAVCLPAMTPITPIKTSGRPA